MRAFFSKIDEQKWCQSAAVVCAVILLIPSEFNGGPNVGNISSNRAYAQEMLMEMDDEYWEMIVIGTWYLESSTRQMTVAVTPKIVITNVTDDTIEGKIVDSRTGHLLEMYGKESVIMAKFGRDNGFSGEWYIAGKPVNGKFVIQIPGEYRDADYVRLYVNSNSFSVSPSKDALLPQKTTTITTTSVQNVTGISTIKVANATAIITAQNGNATITITVTNSTATTTIKVVNAAAVTTNQTGTTATVTVTNATDITTAVAKTTTAIKNQYFVGEMLTVAVKEEGIRLFEIKGPLLSIMMHRKSKVSPEPIVYQSHIRVRVDSAFENWRLHP
ncbi:MAG: hypothetical protein ABI347_04780 [Nitrososphaera sp.]|jgi:hypothetical protein